MHCIDLSFGFVFGCMNRNRKCTSWQGFIQLNRVIPLVKLYFHLKPVLFPATCGKGYIKVHPQGHHAWETSPGSSTGSHAIRQWAPAVLGPHSLVLSPSPASIAFLEYETYRQWRESEPATEHNPLINALIHRVMFMDALVMINHYCMIMKIDFCS